MTGMQVAIGNMGWYLCDSEDDPQFDYVELDGRDAFIVQWLNQFRGDAWALRSLRRLLGETHPWADDQQILSDAGWQLATGAWKAPFPKEKRRSSSSSSPSSDPPVIPGDIDPAALAQAQREAAAAGVSFCEECLCAQLANA